MRSGLRFETFTFAVVAAAVAGCVASGAGQGGDAGAGGSIMMMPGGSGGGSAGSGTAGSGSAGSGACTTPPTAHMSWKFSTGDSNGPFITCAQLGATTLEVFMNEAHSQFSCAAQSGTTGPLMAGSYTPRLLITAAQGTIIVNDNFPNPITIPSCGVDDLGTLVILVSPSTGAAGMSGGTAGSTGTAGAGTAGAAGGTGPCNALPIFAMHQCSYPNACHDAKGTAAGFNMADTNWQTKLVGVSPSSGGGNGFMSQCTKVGMPYLIAGSVPARGLFLEKLKATPICGSQMPALPPLLTAQELDCVQRWANGLTKP